MFGFLKKKKREKRDHDSLNAVASVFGTIDRLERSGLIAWDGIKRRLYLSESLVAVVSAKADGMQHLLDNVALWAKFRELSGQWAEFFEHRETEAMRTAAQANPAITVEELRNVKMQSRATISEEDLQCFEPEVSDLEFYVLKNATVVDAAQGAKAAVRLVGIYSYETGKIETKEI